MSGAANKLIHLTHLPQAILDCLRWLLLAWCCLLSMPTQAEPATILLAYESRNEFVDDIITTLNNELQNTAQLAQLDLSSQAIADTSVFQQYKTIIALGSKATETLLDKNLQTPVISLLLSQQSWQQINEHQHPHPSWSAIVLDQPLNRQLLLAGELFGKQAAIGALLGPYSARLEQALNHQAERNQIIIETRSMQSSEQLIPVLRDLLDEIDVLLALPDTQVYNKQTIQGILLLTYRNKIPVIGFSQAYAKAGAAAALYSDPEQIARQGAELIRLQLNGGTLENMYYPKYFSVSFNQQVAKTIGMKIPDTRTLIDNIMAKERNRP